MSRNELYQKFFTSYKKVHQSLSGDIVQTNANKEWNEAKARFSKNTQGFESYIQQRINVYNAKVVQNKVTFLNYFTKTTPSCSQNLKSTTADEKTSSKTVLSSPLEALDTHLSRKESNILQRTYSTPAQNETVSKVQALESMLASQILAKNANLGGETTNDDIKTLQKKLKETNKKLNSQRANAEYQRKFRESRKRKLTEICASNDKAALSLKLRNVVGRPRIEHDQPEILQAIIDLATFGGAAHDRRRTEEIRACITLDDLQEKLIARGFNLSRHATYLRLLPKNSKTIEGKTHIVTVPVKLCKAQNDLHKNHIDSKFCTTSIRYVESLSSILGPNQVCFLSQDDKARIPIGLKAATKQAPILMHLEYRVKLPDHDWVIAERHKLIPSVYASIVIKNQGLGNPEHVTYSGPTYIAIRSGKHDSSTAITHFDDFQRLVNLKEFDNIIKFNGLIKPIVVITSDGGPDENPRYPKVISSAINHFKEYDLDALFIVTNAPGRSAFNRVERRMAPLSRKLSGLILPHDSYGAHLDNNGKTIDIELEKENFAAAGKILGNIFSESEIDSHPVVAEYIHPKEKSSELILNVNDEWYAKHVRESQYFLQVSKCLDEQCCKPHRSNLLNVLPTGFFPPPCLVKQNLETGLLETVAPNQADEDAKFLPLFQRLAMKNLKLHSEEFKEIPYDYYCPTVQTQLQGRVCKTCGLYFATKKAVNIHVKHLKHTMRSQYKQKKVVSIEAERNTEYLCFVKDDRTGEKDVEWREKIDVTEEIGNEIINNCKTNEIEEESSVPIIQSLSEWVENPWIDE